MQNNPLIYTKPYLKGKYKLDFLTVIQASLFNGELLKFFVQLVRLFVFGCFEHFLSTKNRHNQVLISGV